MAELVAFAHQNGLLATRALARCEQKRLGQFMTPPAVAIFMAQRSLPTQNLREVRVLDPAAGAGILAAAVVELLVSNEAPPDRITVTLCELDERLVPVLRRLADKMRREARKRGLTLSVSIRQCDFLLSSTATTQKPVADIIISNPPYFKLNASDPRAVAHPYAVYGQPNIYGLFMAACAGLLSPAGRWSFITPRSWTNGAYFSAVRKYLFGCLHIDAIHVFESRKDHFTDDEILQEAMITWATAQARPNPEVVVSSSAGSRDISDARLLRLPLNQVIGRDDEVVLPTHAPSALTNLTATLATYGLKVSTGPVVAFRAAEFVKEKASNGTVPLLWMQHITHMRVKWPINKKREHITSTAGSAWMLVPNDNMVVMRRFSPKEDVRRITAAPCISRTLPGAVLGLENHTNYIYRPGGRLTDQEVCGLAAFLNSRVVDEYLRTVAGNTQVNAGDLRKLPLPPLDSIVAIGRAARVGISLSEVDEIVDAVLEDVQRQEAVLGGI